MILLNIILILFNIILLFLGYIIIYKKIKKKLINKEILNKVKDEINSIIINLNETTLNNISLIEEKKKNLDKRIILADKKTAGLETALLKKDQNNIKKDLFDDNLKIYSPKDVLKQSRNITENENSTKKIKNIDNELKDLSMIEKAVFLLKKGWSVKDIQKKIGISSGELELLMNIENIKDLAYDI
jgi:hypothetical protein